MALRTRKQTVPCKLPTTRSDQTYPGHRSPQASHDGEYQLAWSLRRNFWRCFLLWTGQHTIDAPCGFDQEKSCGFWRSARTSPCRLHPRPPNSQPWAGLVRRPCLQPAAWRRWPAERCPHGLVRRCRRCPWRQDPSEREHRGLCGGPRRRALRAVRAAAHPVGAFPLAYFASSPFLLSEAPVQRSAEGRLRSKTEAGAARHPPTAARLARR
mmetsp:Transcript_52758/g.115700  ORF Transcript_52758/g.115700 Transcript_52758/m.115700 type:complete len:211 (-) Transcript_52758:58-690(-)